MGQTFQALKTAEKKLHMESELNRVHQDSVRDKKTPFYSAGNPASGSMEGQAEAFMAQIVIQ